MEVFIGDIYWMNFREDLEAMNFDEYVVSNRASRISMREYNYIRDPFEFDAKYDNIILE